MKKKIYQFSNQLNLEGVKKVDLKICGGVIGIIAYNSKKMSNNSQNQNDNAVEVIKVENEPMLDEGEIYYREAQSSKVGNHGELLYKLWDDEGNAMGYVDDDYVFAEDGEEADFTDAEMEEDQEEINANSNQKIIGKILKGNKN